MKNRLYMTLALLLLSVVGFRSNAQQLGVKTNALMWAALTPNLGCEIVLKEHSSLDISVFGHYKPYGLESKIMAVQPEYRYWFGGRPMTREYVGVSAMVVNYDMTMKGHVYDGMGASLGVTGGYAFMLGKKWRFELCGGVSILFFHQKQYYQNDDYYVNEATAANSWGYKLFPAKLGVSFTYIIK